MALSNKFGWLVLTTGNKSEMATGYTTLYGDMAGGFAVIKDMPKILVCELARYRNSIVSYDLISSTIIDKEPSAELKPEQRDTDILLPYGLLDPVLSAYVEEDKSVEQIIAMGLEILGLAYVKKHNLEDKITYKKERVREFVKSRELTGNSYSFLRDATEDWYVLRNHAFHQGKLPDWPQDRFERRWRQLAEFASFVLADLLQPQSQVQRDQIGARLSGY